MNKEWVFSLSWNWSTCRSVVWPIYFPQLCKRNGNLGPRERSINSTCEWPFQIKVGLMWAEKLSKQWTPCITTSLRLWDQFLLEHIVHRLNIEGFTRHNKQYIIEGTSEDRWVTPVEWRCDMLWRGGAVTVTEGDAQATLWLQSLVCDYILDAQHDRQQSPISARASFKQPPFKPLEVLYLRTVTLWSNSSLKTIPNSLCAYAHLANKVRSDDVQTWMIKEMFGMEQNLGLTNKGIKLHFWWQTDSMNLWTDTLIKKFHDSKKIIILRIFYHSKMKKHSG